MGSSLVGKRVSWEHRSEVRFLSLQCVRTTDASRLIVWRFPHDCLSGSKWGFDSPWARTLARSSTPMRRQRICEYDLTMAQEMLARAYSAEGATGESTRRAPSGAEK